MHRLVPFLIILCLFFAPISLGAQSLDGLEFIKFRQITMENGLSNNMGYKTAEGPFGFIWMATANGLCRYDGHNFKTFFHDPSDPNSISQDYIRYVYADSKGYIWAGTHSEGLNRFDYQTGKFTRYKHDTNNPFSICDNEILYVFEDSQHKLWVGTEHGLSVFDYKTEHFTSYVNDPKDPETIGEGGIISIAEDAKGRIWISTWNGGLDLFVPGSPPINKDRFRRFYPAGAQHFWSLFLDSRKRFWVGSFSSGLFLMKTDDRQSLMELEPQFINFRHDDNNNRNLSFDIIFDIEEDTKGRIWIATPFGLNVCNPNMLDPTRMDLATLEKRKEQVVFQRYNFKFGSSDGLPSHEIRGLGKNREGTFFVSTVGGVAIFNPGKQQFRARYITENEKLGIVIANSVAKGPDNIIWVGTNGDGLRCYSLRTNKDKPFESIRPGATKMTGTNVYNIYLRNGSELWVSSELGLGILNLSDYSYRMVIPASKYGSGESEKTFESRQIYEDSKGNMWYATTSGLFQYNLQSKKITAFKYDESSMNSISNQVVMGITEDGTGCYVLATNNGADRLCLDKDNPDGYGITHFKHQSNDENSLPSNKVTSVCQMNGKIYLGTENGLCQYLPSEKRFVTFGKHGSSGGRFINSLVPGGGNKLWGATTANIFQFDTGNLTFQYFDKSDGVHDDFFRFSSAYKLPGNEIVFTGRLGFTSVFEQSIQINTEPARVMLTDFMVNNKLRDIGKDPVLIDKITLPYWEHNITFEFAATNFTKPKLSAYAYKMEGVDEDWIYVGRRNVAPYTNLRGGDYIFKVKGTNNDGVWGDDSAALSIPVHIAIPFWQSAWFYALCVAVVILGIIGFIRLRTRAFKNKNKLLESHNYALNREVTERKKAEESLMKLNEELTRSNYDLEQYAYIASHDLQEPLRMVGNFVQLLNRRNADKLDESGKEYIRFAVEGVTRMSELIQNLLKFSTVGKKDTEFIAADLNQVLNKKLLDLRQVIQEKNTEFEVSGLPGLIVCEPDQIGMVFYNLIHNSLKFNTNCKPAIIVSCIEQKDFWQFSVQDNGIGIGMEYQAKVFEIFKRLHARKEFEGHGIGLSLCKRIVNRHGGNIWFDSTIGEGTTFHFEISKSLCQSQLQIATEVEME